MSGDPWKFYGHKQWPELCGFGNLSGWSMIPLLGRFALRALLGARTAVLVERDGLRASGNRTMSTAADRVNARKVGQQRGLRRGNVFALRLTDEQRSRLEALRAETAGPRGLGPFLVWAAERAAIKRVLPTQAGITSGERARVLPGQAGHYPAAVAAVVLPAPGPGNTGAQVLPRRTILDLCSGSGAWSQPYKEAGYDVIRVTLPDADVRAFKPPPDVWGVLAAPPCSQFSLARNGKDSPRDFAGALEVVTACLRIIAVVRPQWWALENPVGLLGRWMGEPRDVWEPFEFGDRWTKRTAIWGDFVIPARGPFVGPEGSAMDRATAEERAVTPPGFARAFFEANP